MYVPAQSATGLAESTSSLPSSLGSVRTISTIGLRLANSILQFRMRLQPQRQSSAHGREDQECEHKRKREKCNTAQHAADNGADVHGGTTMFRLLGAG